MVANKLERHLLRWMHRCFWQDDRIEGRLWRQKSVGNAGVESLFGKTADKRGGRMRGVAGLSSLTRARKAAHGSSMSLSIVVSLEPWRSNTRAKLGAPPYRKSAAMLVTTPVLRPISCSRRASLVSWLTLLRGERPPAPECTFRYRPLSRSGTLPAQRRSCRHVRCRSRRGRSSR